MYTIMPCCCFKILTGKRSRFVAVLKMCTDHISQKKDGKERKRRGRERKRAKDGKEKKIIEQRRTSVLLF